tara:strand:+ start:121 stop:750 length:630 start_codon:yes stop_codon:yes gene_type:complete
MFFALVLSSCSSGDQSGAGTSLEQTLVDQEWEILNGTERLFLNSDDGILYSKENTCDDFIAEGKYLFSENELYITYTTESLEVTELYGEIHSFSIEEFSFVLYEDSTSLEAVNEVFIAVEPIIFGCLLDVEASNYNPDADCDSCIYDVENVDATCTCYSEEIVDADGNTIQEAMVTVSNCTGCDLFEIEVFEQACEDLDESDIWYCVLD